MGIDQLRDGQHARVVGRVRPAGALRRSPGGVECVYWDRRRGLDAEPGERSTDPFWVEDGAGRVLVRADDVQVRARADRREQVVEKATAEMAVLSEELRTLRVRLVDEDDPELRARRRHLAKVATLLCKVRAHARGRVHGGQGTLSSQAAWIERNQHLADEGPGSATTRIAIERWEMTLSAGDEVDLEATFRIEPVPPGLGIGGGYRSRATCLVARGATVVGRGEARPPRPEEPAPEEPRPAEDRPSRRADPFERAVLLVVSGITVGAAILWALL